MADLHAQHAHARVAALERELQSIRDTERDPRPYEVAQRRADAVAALHADRAPDPILGESPLDYRKRLLRRFQGFSPGFEKTNFFAADAASLDVLESKIYRDAEQAAYRPDAQPGVLRAVESRDAAGRLITKYVGDVGEFIAPFVQDGTVVKLRS
jgi:hypothetical protein